MASPQFDPKTGKARVFFRCGGRQVTISLSRVAGIVSDHQARVPRVSVNPRHVFSPEETAKGVRPGSKRRHACQWSGRIRRDRRRDEGTPGPESHLLRHRRRLERRGHRTRYGSLYDAANVYRIIGKYVA